MSLLPYDVLEKILSYNHLSLQDVVNFCSSCKHNRVMLDCNRLWKNKFLQRWPQLKLKPAENWYEEVVYFYRLISRCKQILSCMPERYCCFMDISEREYDVWHELTEERPNSHTYLIEILRDIIDKHVEIPTLHTVPLFMDGNRTLKYYSIKALRFLIKRTLRKRWADYISQDNKIKLLEWGAVFVAQWCQPEMHIDENYITRRFDCIAERVKYNLKGKYPNHSIFKKTSDDFRRWRTENLEDNQFSEIECKQIIQSLVCILSYQMDLKGNTENYYAIPNSFINKVLETRRGMPILLSIIYESVARRLGVLLEPTNVPRHFMLQFRAGTGPHQGNYLLDAYNGGKLLLPQECQTLRLKPNEFLPRASFETVIERVAANIELALRRIHAHSNGLNGLNALELLVTINPHDLTNIVQLARQYMLYNMDTQPLEEYMLLHNPVDSPLGPQIERIIKMLRDYEANVKVVDKGDFTFFGKTRSTTTPRTPELKFAVGMVMRHLLYNYICVICDWHLKCRASNEWQTSMGVHRLQFKADQPYYSVIADDGSQRYVAQENLEPASANETLLQVEDIGRFFSHYFEIHFIPNEQKERNYPEDAVVRNRFYQERVLENSERYLTFTADS